MKYLVRLRPLMPFFFGGSRTFRDSYIARSRRWPQQTHLLGMIRRVLLEKEGLLISNGDGRWKRAPGSDQDFLNLVGDTTEVTNDLGIIKKISPVFLASYQGDSLSDFHFQAPKDSGFSGSSGDESICVLSRGVWKSPFNLDGYSPKNGIQDNLTDKGFWEAYKKSSTALTRLNFSDFFQQVEHIGIRRNDKRQVEEDSEGSLYRRFAWKLKKDDAGRTCEFAFKLELSEDKFSGNFSRLVYLGADRSTFNMKCEPWNDEIHSTLFPQSSEENIHKAACLSEFAPSDKPSNLKFILSEKNRPFEMIVFKRNENKSGTPRWVNKMNLFPKGTVLFFTENMQRPDNGNSFLTKIGYNHLLYI